MDIIRPVYINRTTDRQISLTSVNDIVIIRRIITDATGRAIAICDTRKDAEEIMNALNKENL